IAQPALGRQVRQLESELGVSLLYRHGRGVRPTEEGSQFYNTITPILRELRHAADELRAASETLSGEVSVGLPPSIGATIGADLIECVRQEHPLIKLHVVDGFSGFVNEWLVAGRIDLAVVNEARQSPMIRSDRLLEADLFAVGSKLPGKGANLTFRRLAQCPLVLPTRNHGLRREVERASEEVDLELKIVAEIDSLTAILELVDRGVGTTILPRGAVGAMVKDHLVRRIVSPEIRMSFSLAYSLQRPATAAMREVARSIRLAIKEADELGRLHGQIHTGSA
ncbi:MAG: LysR substrate-binding domain-containing protein, partial [Pseudomonadota bacterium]